MEAFYRLENALRSFATLTKDEIIQISYNQIDYRLKVLELKPYNAVSIIECDMDVDFAPPPGYQEPTYKKSEASKPISAPVVSNWKLEFSIFKFAFFFLVYRKITQSTSKRKIRYHMLEKAIDLTVK